MFHCPQGDQPGPPIGSPIANCWTYILDAQGNLCAAGEIGELYIGGVGVGLGYLNRPQLTAERFVPDSFCPRSGATMYRSGDLVARRPDGNLEFHGRVDQQVKIRGIRIEPAEVVAALESIPCVRQAAVIAQESGGTSRLVAFATATQLQTPPTQVLFAELRRRLPAHLVPARLEWVSAFPRLPNGKVDRTALQSMPAEPCVPASAARISTLPESPVERELRHMMEEVLDQPGISGNDDFFARGGDSLMAMDLLSRIERRFGMRLEPRQLLASPTPASLSQTLGDAPESRPHPLVVPLSGDGEGTPLFCIHPGGGNVYCYLELARALGPGVSVYGIQSHGIEDDVRPAETIEALAEEYLDAIRAVTVGRPCYLSGWSFGGLVAFEIAKRLTNEKLASPVVLIDSGKLHAFAVVRALFPDLSVPLFQMPWLDEDELLESFCAQKQRSQLIPPHADRQLSRRILRVFMANVEATLRYQPGQIDQDLVFIEADELLPGMRRPPSQEWREHCRQTHVFRTRGSHLQMVQQPYVNKLAEVLTHVCKTERHR
jgi:thioesterase domain-containing protein/acyl carrier protein